MYPLIAAVCLFNACLVRARNPIFGLTSSQARLLNELNDSDVLFLSGGGYLTGMTLTRLWDNMLLIRLADALGVPTILSGQTIGMFKDPISRILARWGLKKAELIYLRDPVDSARELATLGLSGDWIKSTFDDALFFQSASALKIAELLEESGLNPKNLTSPSMCITGARRRKYRGSLWQTWHGLWIAFVRIRTFRSYLFRWSVRMKPPLKKSERPWPYQGQCQTWLSAGSHRRLDSECGTLCDDETPPDHLRHGGCRTDSFDDV